jgi:hypothetical protein
LVLATAFVLLVAALVLGSLTRPELPPYRLSIPHPTRVGDSLVLGTYTLDASATDRWRYFAFVRNSAVEPPAKWDVAFRRFHVIAGDGAGFVDLGPVPFDSVRELPEAPYRGNETRAGTDSANPAVGKWYSYSMLSHLLQSKHHVYGLRTADGRYAKIELLAYYCADAGTACVTFRYAYQGDGTRRVARLVP